MSFTNDKTTVLEEVHTIALLLLLLDEGPLIKTVIYQKFTTNTSSLQKRIDKLKDAGLVITSPDPSHHSAIRVELTTKGKVVANKLREIEIVLTNE